VNWYFGETGSGKTRAVHKRESLHELWIAGEQSNFFNNYENQPAALFDDFRGDFCKFHVLLVLLDRYPYTVNVKYGCAQWNSKRIYLTSSKPPQEVYNKSDEDMQQLLRRIDNIIQFKLFGGQTVHVIVKGCYKEC
jgi:hypothetical protein